MTYYTLQQPVSADLVIKKSKFLGFGYPISNRQDLMFHVEQLRQQFNDARHVCYGYVIGDPINSRYAGFDDDGEPSGTAGKPILHALQSKLIGDTAIIVVRYFGGIKLGAGGLTRAYGHTAQAVIEQMQLQAYHAMSSISVTTDFAHEAYTRHLLEQYHAHINSVQYSNHVTLTVTIAHDDIQSLADSLGIYAKIYA